MIDQNRQLAFTDVALQKGFAMQCERILNDNEISRAYEISMPDIMLHALRDCSQAKSLDAPGPMLALLIAAALQATLSLRPAKRLPSQASLLASSEHKKSKGEMRMGEKFTGKRNKRGDWKPGEPLHIAPVFVWPLKPLALLKYLFGYPGYFLPWGIIYMAAPIVTWLYFTPAMADMKTFAPGWIAYILFRNMIMITAVIVLWQGWLHWKKAQGTDWKYTNKWFARDNPIFLFSNQTLDNLFWTYVSALPIWTAFEAATMWLYANAYIPYVSPSEQPIYFVFMMVLVPLMRETHFYLIHRLIHWGPLYNWVHYLHHNNVDPGPVTGLAMHPVEHLLYWTGVMIHWVIPSHPIHALFHLQHAAITPAQGHAGFERVVIGDGLHIKTGDYFHYLHHKYFECNFGGDGPVNLDRAFGTFHDGTDAATERMNERFLVRAAQKAAAEKGS